MNKHKADDGLSHVVKMLGNGSESRPDAIREAIKDMGTIIEVRGSERYTRIANDYSAIISRRLSFDERKTVIIVALTKSEAQPIAEAMRQTSAMQGLPEGDVLTLSASQAMVADVALVAVGREVFDTLSREQLYVALSRGREAVWLYTDDKAGLLEATRICASA